MTTTVESETARPETTACPKGEGCEEFVHDIYPHQGIALLRYAARLLNGDWHKGEDVLQEATVRAWAHYGTAATDSDSLRPWLFTVVRNLVIDQHRARRIRPPRPIASATSAFL